MQESIWHELTHSIEHGHGDFDDAQRDKPGFAERHTAYMEAIGAALRHLDNIERAAKGGGPFATPEALRKGWAAFVEEYERGATLVNPGVYADPTPNARAEMERWFGFHVRPDEILALYQSGCPGAGGQALAEALSQSALNIISVPPDRVGGGERTGAERVP